MDTAKTYYCQNCGAVMEFDAASQNLKCPSCGNKIEIENDESKVGKLQWQNMLRRS